MEKSPLKYNDSLVKAVAEAYGSEKSTVTPDMISKASEPIFGALSGLIKDSDNNTRKAVALRGSANSDQSGTPPVILDKILEIQAKMDESFKIEDKNESFVMEQNAESAIRKLAQTRDYVAQLQEHTLNNIGDISNAVNMENKLLWNTVAQGNIWDIMEYDGAGGFNIPNPFGGSIGILGLDFMPTKDPDYYNRDQKVVDTLESSYTKKKGKYSSETILDQLKKQAVQSAKLLNTTSQDSKFDDPLFPEFVKRVYADTDEFVDLDIKMFQNNPSEYYEANTYFSEDETEEEKLALYENTMKHEDIDKEWVEFKASKYMESIIETEALEKQKQEENKALVTGTTKDWSQPKQ